MILSANLINEVNSFLWVPCLKDSQASVKESIIWKDVLCLTTEMKFTKM